MWRGRGGESEVCNMAVYTRYVHRCVYEEAGVVDVIATSSENEGEKVHG